MSSWESLSSTSPHSFSIFLQGKKQITWSGARWATGKWKEAWVWFPRSSRTYCGGGDAKGLHVVSGVTVLCLSLGDIKRLLLVAYEEAITTDPSLWRPKSTSLKKGGEIIVSTGKHFPLHIKVTYKGVWRFWPFWWRPKCTVYTFPWDYVLLKVFLQLLLSCLETALKHL